MVTPKKNWIACQEYPGFQDSKTVFRLAKFHWEVGRSAQYVCLPTILCPKPLLKPDDDMTKVSPLQQKLINLKKS